MPGSSSRAPGATSTATSSAARAGVSFSAQTSGDRPGRAKPDPRPLLTLAGCAVAAATRREGETKSRRDRRYARLVARRTGQKLLQFDRKLGARFVAGADEAGRG